MNSGNPPVHAAPLIHRWHSYEIVHWWDVFKSKLRTWTSIELHDKYVSYGGQFTQKQMFTKLVTHLAKDVVVLGIEGCASIVGFQEFISKTTKITELDTMDEEKEDALVRKITTETRGIQFNKKKL